MVEIKFLGGANEVGRAAFLIDSGIEKFLLDYGMNVQQYTIPQQPPTSLDGLFISHAHLDHLGMLPEIYNRGYNQKTFLTKTTKDLSQLLLYDAIKVQTAQGRPPFFLPTDIEKFEKHSEVLDFNKQALMVILVFVALFAQMVKILISGKFSANLNKTHVAVSVLFLVYLASTIFSQDKYGSFWGWPRITVESLLTITCLCLFYFIVSNIFSKKEILISMTIFLLSCLLATLFGILQLLGLFIVPLNFTKTGSFNTFGSVGNFGNILAILLPLLTVFVVTVKEKWLRIIFGVGIVITAISLLLINPLAWPTRLPNFGLEPLNSTAVGMIRAPLSLAK